MTYILQTHHLVKCFKDKEVVQDVNLHIKKGEVYGFLGPNGAGKSTVMKLIMNLLQPTSGSIELFGEEVKMNSVEHLKRVGAIIENPIFYEKLTAKENLELHCEYMGYYNLKEIDEVLKLVNLIEKNKAVGHFSLGMKQRLALARAILTKPELLILDEPINGLDPEGISEIRNLIKKLSREYGITVMISSHILSEVEQIADTIGVIQEGRLIKEVAMNEIHHLQEEYIEIVVDDVTKTVGLIEMQLGISALRIIDEHVVRIYDDSVTINKVSQILITHGINLESISQRRGSLEDYFLRLTKGEGLCV
ncbi:MAG: ABC transporter ATP-binding protein [Cellulosilyticum sp.]|nr:ABC transporter ATP-binding protein [Cellulosilyticum sp.]